MCVCVCVCVCVCMRRPSGPSLHGSNSGCHHFMAGAGGGGVGGGECGVKRGSIKEEKP